MLSVAKINILGEERRGRTPPLLSLSFALLSSLCDVFVAEQPDKTSKNHEARSRKMAVIWGKNGGGWRVTG